VDAYQAQRCGTAVAAAVALGLTVAGCKAAPVVVTADGYSAAGLDASADRACTVFAAGYRRAATPAARLALADQVATDAARSPNTAIAYRAGAMGRSADHSNFSWRTASSGFLKACRRAGWRPPHR
jgi:hypothetical protein